MRALEAGQPPWTAPPRTRPMAVNPFAPTPAAAGTPATLRLATAALRGDGNFKAYAEQFGTSAPDSPPPASSSPAPSEPAGAAGFQLEGVTAALFGEPPSSPGADSPSQGEPDAVVQSPSYTPAAPGAFKGLP